MTAELLSAKLIWDRTPHNCSSDLTRFKDRWYVVCREGNGMYAPDSSVRVNTSADGLKWESAALISSPTPKTGLAYPNLMVTSDGQLMRSARTLTGASHVREIPLTP